MNAPVRKQIIIPYKPRDAFRPYHKRAEKFAALVARRRGGKSVCAVNDQIRRAMLNTRKFPEPRYAFIGPQFKQTRRNIWNYLVHYTKPLPGVAVNNSRHEVTLPNGAVIYIDGADNPDAIRGGYLDGVVLDEFQDMKPLALETVIFPMLSDYDGWLTVTGSAKGRNQLFRIVELAKRDPDWFCDIVPFTGRDWPDTEAVLRLKRLIVPEIFEQEYECSFDAAIVGAYYGKDLAASEREGRITDVPVDPSLPVHTSWDLGVGDSTAIWFFQVHGAEIRVVDHYENHGEGLPHYVEVIRRKGYPKGDDWVPHDARVKEFGTGRTRVETMIDRGLKPRVVPMHGLMDGINATRLTIPRCWFDRDKCEQGLEALRQYQTEFDDEKKTFKDTPKHDWTSHSADAFRYLAMAWREIVGESKPKDPIAALTRPRTIAEVIEDRPDDD